jgi:multidrug efflux pump subunit AcrA (membrane-fusion protein)
MLVELEPPSGGLDLARRQLAVDRARLRLEANDDPLQTALLSLDLRQARLEQTAAEKGDHERFLRSPLDGTVTAVNIRVGDLVGPALAASQILLHVADLTRFVVEVEAEESQVQEVKEGNAALIYLPDGSVISGTVESDPNLRRGGGGLSGLAGPVTFGVTVTVELGDGRPPLIGSHVRVEIAVQSHLDIPIVPATAVFWHDGSPWVLLKRAEGWTPQIVNLRGTDDIMVAIDEEFLGSEVLVAETATLLDLSGLLR